MIFSASSQSAQIRIDKVWVAVDVGKVVDPVNFENQVQGGVIWGLGHAINCELTYAKSAVQQTNYNHHEAMRIYQCPVIEGEPAVNWRFAGTAFLLSGCRR
ncbi:molybdopterin cofactor-binding domain-containing protein [Bradyrhizobium sp. 1200_D9_N1_1]|uniref:molybdopterin cofactor-binding domain-containing protein n=1 Tax=Bradyrhizobium sp. 1200_D9_N1_1 TaxID=3239013 RepID=UPI003D39EDB3